MATKGAAFIVGVMFGAFIVSIFIAFAEFVLNSACASITGIL